MCWLSYKDPYLDHIWNEVKIASLANGRGPWCLNTTKHNGKPNTASDRTQVARDVLEL